MDDMSPAERAHLELETYTLHAGIEDYLELVLQFGFVCLFVAAYPLVLPLALLSNYLETRVDAKKIATVYHRPTPLGAADIGSWYFIMQIMGWASVATNCGLAVFTIRLQFVDQLGATGKVRSRNRRFKLVLRSLRNGTVCLSCLVCLVSNSLIYRVPPILPLSNIPTHIRPPPPFPPCRRSGYLISC